MAKKPTTKAPKKLTKLEMKGELKKVKRRVVVVKGMLTKGNTESAQRALHRLALLMNDLIDRAV